MLLLVVHAGLLAYAATRHSPTLEEPGYIAIGLSYWKFGYLKAYRATPPLVPCISSIPVVIAGYHADWSNFNDSPGSRSEFRMGEAFIMANGERSLWLVTIARWACIPFSLIGCLFCFFWSRDLWGSNLAGLLSLFMWCFDPNVLANGELVSSDCAATSFGLGATYLFWRWLKEPCWSRAVVVGFVLGLAELTKTSWLVLFVVWPFLWIFWQVSHRPVRHTFASAPTWSASSLNTQVSSIQLGVILLLGAFTLNFGYGFDGSLTRLKEFRFVSAALTGQETPRAPGNRFADSIFGEVPMPVPKQYLLGIDVQIRDCENSVQQSYLRAERKYGTWWYDYIYGLVVRTPHGMQLAVLLAMFTVIHRLWSGPDHSLKMFPGTRSTEDKAEGDQPRVAKDCWRSCDLATLVVPGIVVIVLVSCQLGFDHHVRYVFPVLGSSYVFVGVTATWFTAHGRS